MAYFYIIERNGQTEYAVSESPPEADYQMLTEEEFNSIINDLNEETF